MAEAIAPAEKRCLIVKATFGLATISRLVGRPRMRCGRVTPASSIRTENLYPQLRPVLPAVGWYLWRSRRCKRQRLAYELRRQVDRRIRQERQAADTTGRHYIWRQTRPDAGRHRHTQH